MEPELEEWLDDLLVKLEPRAIILPVEGDVIGYTWNAKKGTLRFLNSKEAERLTKKGKVWKPLGVDWK